MKIRGIEYTLFKDYDKGRYTNLCFADKVTYMHGRVRRILIGPCLEAMKSALKTDLGLVLVTAACAGISAAGTYLNGQQAPPGKDKQHFADFVNAYMNPDLQTAGPDNMTWTDWLYSHVRRGLAHSFTIDSGGVEYELEGYMEMKRYGREINPHALL